MGRLADGRYKLDITKEEMKKLGFRYNNEYDGYVYRFPVYKYNKIPILFCKMGIDEETNQVWFNIYDNNGLYMPYYNQEYGRNTLISLIDERIEKEFSKLGIRKVN